MKKFRKDAGTLFRATLMLCLFVSIGCTMLKPAPVVTMPEARAVPIRKGDPSPLNGWVLSESAVAKILEAAERCQEK